MGFADMLIRLRIVYGNKESLKTAEDVMRFINKTAREASIVLAKERGAFPISKKACSKTDKELHRHHHRSDRHLEPHSGVFFGHRAFLLSKLHPPGA